MFVESFFPHEILIGLVNDGFTMHSHFCFHVDSNNTIYTEVINGSPLLAKKKCNVERDLE